MQSSEQILRKYLLGGVAWRCLVLLKALGVEVRMLKKHVALTSDVLSCMNVVALRRGHSTPPTSRQKDVVINGNCNFLNS